ncbi:MAG TPA: EAL domain-containing protein [Steroidobacteraceae bacterium]|nr:EAL domain-containing protein [Steroidobacteraceae bacterium]
MAVIVPGLYILAGAIAYAMLQSLVSPAARREVPALRAFAATCLFAALVALFAARALQASSGAQYIRALKLNIDCLVLTALGFSVFVSWYARLTGRRARAAFAAYAVICLILIAVNEGRTYGLQYARFDGITRLRLPWQETVVRGVGRNGLSLYLTIAALDGVVAYGLVVLLRLYRRTRDRSVLWMLASLAAYVPFAVEGALARFSVIRGVAAGPFGMLIVVAVTGATLAKESKRKLIDSEERFRVLFEHSPYAVMAIEPESGRILQANGIALELYGYDAGELSRKTLSDLTAPEEMSEGMRRQDDLSDGRVERQRSERRFVRKDGRALITDCAISALKDGGGAVVRLIACLSDITERKRLEAALGDSERKLRNLFELSPLGIVLTVDGNYFEFNRAFEAMTGYSAEELRTIDHWQLTPRKYEEEERRQLDLLLRTGRFGPFEKEYRRKDGSLIPLRLNGMLIGDGTPLYVWSIVEDISADRRAQEALQRESAKLRESETRLRTLIEQSPMAISFSRDGVTLEVNAQYLAMFGYTSAAEVCGSALVERIAPSRRAEMREIIERRRQGLPTPPSYETVGMRRDGSEFPLFVSTKRVELADGALTMAFLMDFTERKKTEERIRQLAFFDQLTQLPNRELLQDRLNQALSASARSGHYGALLLLNLDNFKSVNDTLGHAAGDALLQQVAARLAAEVKSGDTLARVDRDEFVVLLEELAPQPLAAAAQAKAIGLRMMSALSGSYALAGGESHVGCSVGATILAGHRQTPQDLLQQANIALHQAKKAGRNALRFFDPGMQESVNARASLEGELRNAVASSQFMLHYQLQVDENRRAIGAEALVRWNHPERGLVFPGEFIALAEETHLVLPIGQWVIDAACAKLAAWSREPRTCELSLAVNVSSLQFQQSDFAVQVLGAIRRHGVDARRLKLELTETMLQGDLERTVSTMNLLKAEGVQFSLDDFGTGYSSLQYLKQLPLDQLKIDRSFVHNIAVDPNDRAIVTTIIAIADHLGLDVIAEGVETLEQLEVLRKCGCNCYQGYLFGRPAAAERLFGAEIRAVTRMG